MRSLPAAFFAAVTLVAAPAFAADGGLRKCSDDGLSSIGTDGVAVSCAPYRCGSSGECLTICASSADCAAGNVCDGASQQCVGTARCSADGFSAIARDGSVTSCAPYKCMAGTCLVTCASDADCAAPNVCGTATKSCVVTENPKASESQSDEGTCSYGARGTPLFGLALGSLALVARARRRR